MSSQSLAAIVRRFLDEPADDSGWLPAFIRWEVEGLLIAEDAISWLERTERTELYARAALAERTRNRIIDATKQVVDVFDEHGIHLMAIKGLSTERHYTSADGGRWFGDADLFAADIADPKLLTLALQQLGMAPQAAKGTAALERAGSLGAVLLGVDGVEIDLHFAPTGQLFRYPDQSRTFTETAVDWDDRIRAPSVEFDLVIAAVNTVRDVGWSMKSAVDTVQILRHSEIDWSHYSRLSESFGMQRVTQVGLGLVIKELEPELAQRVPSHLQKSARISLGRKRTMLTPKRGAVSGLYYGPGRGRAGLALLRWIVPAPARIHAHYSMDGSSSYGSLVRRLQAERFSKAVAAVRRSPVNDA